MEYFDVDIAESFRQKFAIGCSELSGIRVFESYKVEIIDLYRVILRKLILWEKLIFCITT